MPPWARVATVDGESLTISAGIGKQACMWTGRMPAPLPAPAGARNIDVMLGDPAPAAHTRGARLPRLRRVAGRIERFYWGSGLCDDVPALAWYLIGALVPFALGIAAIAAIVLGDAAQAEAVAARLAKVLPAGARDQVIELVLRTRRDSPWLLTLAVVSMVWASSGATGVVERVQSRLLAVPRRGPVRLKLRHLGLAAAMAVLIAMMGIAATEATNLRTRLGVGSPRWALSIVATLLIAAVCALLYRFATTHRLSWRAALLGGLPAALIVEVTPLIAGYYMRAVAGRTVVQVFLVLAGLLFSCYFVAVGLLIGAGLAVQAERARSPSSGWDDVVSTGPA
jgi:uncharacterized BrkB/YihY/UPF0761 family membrane protein